MGLDIAYARQFRQRLGFSGEKEAVDFLGAKDIRAPVDSQYIDDLLDRLIDVFARLNRNVHSSVTQPDIDRFCQKNITAIYETIKNHDILPTLNNQGRRPEEVLFSWLRGFATAQYFQSAIELAFGAVAIEAIGDDNYTSKETFRRSAKADFSVHLPGGASLRVEAQAAFQKINDIKQHKVIEARRLWEQERVHTWVAHFSIYSGQAAFVGLDSIPDNDIQWITRQQMEGQTVWNIGAEDFAWKMTERVPQVDFDPQ